MMIYNLIIRINLNGLMDIKVIMLLYQMIMIVVIYYHIFLRYGQIGILLMKVLKLKENLYNKIGVVL